MESDKTRHHSNNRDWITEEKETEATIGHGCAFCTDTGSGMGMGCPVCAKREPPELARALPDETEKNLAPEQDGLKTAHGGGTAGKPRPGSMIPWLLAVGFVIVLYAILSL
uniref:Uncharacterized protein n=1 Tax=Candidatus Kentrum sp. TUN TaxID=2126343 RepID=A0A451AXI6_9GAMM|nr:MAG: hypothetical protein BECKTUN1418F_GA0071002_12681 [Candidatus Kentron sp. TUN]VFK63930.1 MAG: hypothetical protein BECKTUN1418D_GA0071000_12321 [Candidatus Kentron sp. TUN]VFK70764.1 MAG: hypothetical protein BECKTUN1418E_GA0071001_12732 [Candidatus Kentron sp. TUN]